MKNAYIVLTRTGSRFSKFLGLFTKAEYNHASICIEEDFREFYSFGRHLIHFPIISGFVIERINCGMYKFFGETRCVVYRLPVNDRKFYRLQAVLDEFRSYPFNYKYNFIGLAGVFFNKPLGMRNHYFCSQFVAYVLEQSGVHQFDKSTMLVTPGDFHSLPGLQKVYEGRLADLPHSETDCPKQPIASIVPVS